MIIENGRFQLEIYDEGALLSVPELWQGLDTWHSGQEVPFYAFSLGKLSIEGPQNPPYATDSPFGDRFKYDVKPGDCPESDVIKGLFERGVDHHLARSGIDPQLWEQRYVEAGAGLYGTSYEQPWHVDVSGAKTPYICHILSRSERVSPTRFSRTSVKVSDLAGGGNHLDPDRIEADAANLWVPKHGELVCFLGHSTLHSGPPVPPIEVNSWREVYKSTTVLSPKSRPKR
jgi:hypothetical protein